uniref:Uncharacterized protein n=1 Tax=Arundo donax TaxID=35708 RepID=A0A0A9AK77_ARUDO
MGSRDEGPPPGAGLVGRDRRNGSRRSLHGSRGPCDDPSRHQQIHPLQDLQEDDRDGDGEGGVAGAEDHAPGH